MDKSMTITPAMGAATPAPAAAGAGLMRSVPVHSMSRIEEHPMWDMLAQIRMKLRAEVPLHRFRVKDLLTLAEGQVFETLAPATEDVPAKGGKGAAGLERI